MNWLHIKLFTRRRTRRFTAAGTTRHSSIGRDSWRLDRVSKCIIHVGRKSGQTSSENQVWGYFFLFYCRDESISWKQQSLFSYFYLLTRSRDTLRIDVMFSTANAAFNFNSNQSVAHSTLTSHFVWVFTCCSSLCSLMIRNVTQHSSRIFFRIRHETFIHYAKIR